MHITLSAPINASFRTAQLAGMFDVPVEERCTQTFDFEDPPVDGDWNIGLIVGPSGSGKSTAAQHLFGERIYRNGNWNDSAVIDNFGELPLKKITKLLTLTGFSSPPSWLKPYSVLSNGEKFRCDLAKALSLNERDCVNPAVGAERADNIERAVGVSQRVTRRLTSAAHSSPTLLPSAVCELPSSLVVFDEYTSVVDRNVAQIASAAIAKGIKNGIIACRFVAVTCHYDVMNWLEPDWVLDTADGTVSRRLLRRPSIVLDIDECSSALWQTFKKHHYLSATLSPSARCYAAVWKEQPVAFCAMLPLWGFKNRWRVSRIVVLPDYQGIGIGSAFMEGLAQEYLCNGKRFSITASHPSVLAHCNGSPHWQTVNVQKFRNGRATVSFEYHP